MLSFVLDDTYQISSGKMEKGNPNLHVTIASTYGVLLIQSNLHAKGLMWWVWLYYRSRQHVPLLTGVALSLEPITLTLCSHSLEI